MLKALLAALLLLPVFGAAARDGIPDNCERASAVYYQENLFPRFNVNNLSLEMVDWSTGAVVRIVDTSLPALNYRFLSWSPDCRYLVGAFSSGAWYDTYLWDTVNGARMGIIEDAYYTPHHITWSPDSRSVVVEGRRGAFLWYVDSNQKLQLTLNANGYGKSFDSIVWNNQAGELETRTVGGAPIRFNLTTGRPTNLTLAEGVYPNVLTFQPEMGAVNAPNAESPYRCQNGRALGVSLRYSDSWDRLVLVDSLTDEIVQVLDSNILNLLGGRQQNSGSMSPDCAFYFAAAQDGRDRIGYVWRLSDGTRAHTFENVPPPARFGNSRAGRALWSPDGRYLIVQTFSGALLWDTVTNTTSTLTPRTDYTGYSFQRVEWDLPSGVLRAVLWGDQTPTTFGLPS
jgi:hypothetical protein